METKLGLDAKLYRNTGSYGSPIWNEIENPKDVTLNLTKTEADVSRRGSGGWKAMVGAMKEAAIDFELVFREGDEDFEALRDSFLENTSVGLAVMDGDIETTGSQGLRADFEVFSFTRNEPLDGAITYTFSIKPTDSDNPPDWLKIE
jgi:predicted secreted protein